MARFLAHLRQNRVSLFFLLAALTAMIACVLRTLAFFISFDAAIGYFHSASALVILTNIFLILCVVFCATIPFLINKKGTPNESVPFPTSQFVTAAATALILCVASFFLLSRTKKIPAPTLLVILAALCLLGSAVYFLLRLYNAKQSTAAPLGFFTIFGAALLLAITYFDRYTQMNAPHKVSSHLCMLAIMFAMLYELRTLLGRPAPRAYAFTTTVAAALCTVLSLSNVLAYLCGIYRNAMYFIFDLLALGFAAYFITKSIRLATIFAAENTEVEE